MGVYIPTALTVASQWPEVMPFAMTSPSQFRPQPPVALESEQWAEDYNEIKELGGKNSSKRSAQQTEDAQFWLLTGPLSTHPLERQIVIQKQMSVIDSARFMAVTTAAEADAMIAVMDAKYKYAFWRPITAIRNGDNDRNAATERDATWQPIDNTPMHPEYPCAHCIVSSALASAVEAMLGTADIPEVTMTSTTAPGVTHRWTNLHAYADEVAAARIAAGFHYTILDRGRSGHGQANRRPYSQDGHAAIGANFSAVNSERGCLPANCLAPCHTHIALALRRSCSQTRLRACSLHLLSTRNVPQRPPLAYRHPGPRLIGSLRS